MCIIKDERITIRINFYHREELLVGVGDSDRNFSRLYRKLRLSENIFEIADDE